MPCHNFKGLDQVILHNYTILKTAVTNETQES